MSLTVITRRDATAIIAGCVAMCAVPSRAGAQTQTTIRVGIQPVEAAAAVYYARDMGLFANAGIEADIQPMQNTPAIAAAIASNAIDIGFITVDVLAEVH
jgi:ABC-type nitrate/sulfonate/bicarbonate transport system substrate-binding protein